MKIAANTLIQGHNRPRKNKNLGAFSSAGEVVDEAEEGIVDEGVWKYGIVENDERKRDDKPVSDKGTESAKVGCEGNDNDAKTWRSASVQLDETTRTTCQTSKV